MEAFQYHHRYICLLQLEDFAGALRDTARNLKVFDFVDEYAVDEDLAWSLQQGHGVRGGVMVRAAWRPLAEITAALLVLHPDAPPCDLSDTSPEAAMALLGGAEPL